MLNEKLASLVVELALEGSEKMQAALKSIQKGMVAVSDVAAHTQIVMGKIAEGAKSIGDAAEKALGPLSGFVKQWLNLSGAAAAIGLFVRQGMQLSYLGDQLRLQFERLGLAIAGLFRPEIEKVIDLVRTAADRIGNLSDEQREALVHWAKMAAVGLLTAIVLPKVFAGVQLVIGGVKLLTAAMTAFDVATGGILPLIGMVVTALTGIGIASKVGQEGAGGILGIFQSIGEALKPVWEALKPVIEAVAKLARTFVEALAPVLEAVAKLLADMVIAVAPAIQAIAEFATMLLEAFKPVLVVLGKIIEAIGWLIKYATPIGWLSMLFGGGDKDKSKGNAKPDESKRGPAPRKSTGFEDLGQTWQRIAQASVNVGMGGKFGKPPEEQAVDLLEQIVENTGGTKQAVERQKPAFA